MSEKELIINKDGAKILTETKFKPFVPKQRQENNKKQLIEMFEKNIASISNK